MVHTNSRGLLAYEVKMHGHNWVKHYPSRDKAYYLGMRKMLALRRATKAVWGFEISLLRAEEKTKIIEVIVSGANPCPKRSTF